MSQQTLLWILLFGVGVLSIWLIAVSSKLDRVQQQLDLVLSNLDGLREYLYEIDPQFADERASDKELEDGSNMFAAYDDFKLLEEKKARGKRTLSTPFHRPDGA
jgi:hypothetical protein